VNLKKCPYFTVNLLSPVHPIQRDYAPLDSFVAFMCVEGTCDVKALDCEVPEDSMVSLRTGEAVLIPAVLNDIRIEPHGMCKLLEVYMEL
jgi:mannose-6-phosphate isomerase